MNTTRSTPSRPALVPVRPGHLTVAAWLVGAVLAVVVSGMDSCSPGYPLHVLNAVLLAAFALQIGAVALACLECGRRAPGSGNALAGAIAATLLALPAGGFVYFVVNFDLCLDGLLF